jgi:hypothetical protein
MLIYWGMFPGDRPSKTEAIQNLGKFAFGDENGHEAALYGSANHRVSGGAEGFSERFARNAQQQR